MRILRDLNKKLLYDTYISLLYITNYSKHFPYIDSFTTNLYYNLPKDSVIPIWRMKALLYTVANKYPSVA